MADKLIRVTLDKYISVFDVSEKIGSRYNALKWWNKVKKNYVYRIAHFRRRQKNKQQTDKTPVLEANDIIRFLKQSSLPFSEREREFDALLEGPLGKALQSGEFMRELFDIQNINSQDM